MLDHPNVHNAKAAVAERRSDLAATAAELRGSLAPDRLMADGAARLQRAVGRALSGAASLVRHNPAATAMVAAGLAWFVLGARDRDRGTAPRFEEVSRWEDEGGTPHPAYDTALDEVAPTAGLARATLRSQAARAVRDFPLPFGLVAAAIGGVLAARLPAGGLEQAVVADARDHLREEARRILDEGQARAERAERGDGGRA